MFLAFLMASFLSWSLIAQSDKAEKQTRPYLDGLTKAALIELAGKDLNIDGENVAVYTVEGKRIKGKQLMDAWISGEYTMDFYVDEHKDIKAVQLKVATEAEKSQMKMTSRQLGDGEKDMVGKEAIPFSVTDMQGNQYKLEALKGKVVVVNFWFIACRPCVMEMPDLNELVEKYKNEEVIFLAFAIDDESSLKRFFSKKEFSYNIVADARQVIYQDYGITSFPTHMVIDKDSKIVYYTDGLGPTTVDDIDGSIERLVK